MPRKHCLFTHNGTPTTKPGTEEDDKRIWLSKLLTAILVRHGDEKPGDYQTPGASGYTPQDLAAAESRFAHLEKQAPVPELDLQLQALALLREGVTIETICEDLSVSQMRLKAWRQNEAFQAEWAEAAAEGQGKKVRNSAVRDSLTAERVVSSNSAPKPIVDYPITPQPLRSAMSRPNTDSEQQAQALEKLANGMPSAEVLKQVAGLSGTKLALWRKDPAFKDKWETAKAAGNKIRDRVYTTKEPAQEPLPRRTIHQQAFAEEHEGVAAPEARVTMQSAVNEPAHYGGRKVFDQMLLLFGKEAVIAFCRLNVYKYISRAGKKPGNSQEQDHSKADWYGQQLAELLKS